MNLIDPAAPTKPLLLLVDDMPANLHVLVAALKTDYRLKTATNGPDALALAARDTDRPELILLDVMMPDMGGIEVLRRLREDIATRDIPVIFVSADTSEQSQLDGFELGADDYLTKPVVSTVLRARVKNLLTRKRTERQLQLAAHVFEHSGEAIMISDRDNRIVELNPAFTRLTGYTLEEVRGQNPRLLSSGRTTPEEYRAMWQALTERGLWQGEMWDRHKNGEVYPKLLTISTVKNARGEVDFYIANFSDISVQKEAARIRHLAYHDALTGLPNRAHLTIALEQALADARRAGGEIAVMFIDMDRFKTINDSLGHHVGDQLLVEVGRRLKECVRESDIVARLGGDEFVVVLTGMASASAVTGVAGKLLNALARPYEVAGHMLHSSPSIGIGLYPADGDDIATLMKNADSAMYHAKEQGRNNAQYFRAEMNVAASKRLTLEHDLRAALDAGQFELYYQPQVHAASGRIRGVEALIRWRHPERGLVSPADFIPVAEETGLIEPIGAWVLDEACRQLAAWRADGIDGIGMAINLSARQLRSPRLVDAVRAALARHALREGDLELEVTESVAMTHPERAIGQLHALRDLGVRLAIDDFGTGYSSLAYLKNLPIQGLKLDRSFVRDIETDANDTAICAATIALAHNLGLEVVAEGVETRAQQCFLTNKHRCDNLQGYLFGKPMPAAELAALLRHAPTVALCQG